MDYTLDTRLRRICSELLNHKGKDIKDIFGYPDYLKVKSCMTLFDYIAPCDIFREVLDAFYESGRCLATLTYLKK